MVTPSKYVDLKHPIRTTYTGMEVIHSIVYTALIHDTCNFQLHTVNAGLSDIARCDSSNT